MYRFLGVGMVALGQCGWPTKAETFSVPVLVPPETIGVCDSIIADHRVGARGDMILEYGCSRICFCICICVCVHT